MIQSTIKTEESKPVNYFPKLLMAEDGDVVLFVEERKGILVYYAGNSEYNHLGQYRDDWYIENFRPFTGEITLRNE